MDRFQPTLLDVGVDLCRPDIRVPQHLLDDSKVGPVRQQVRRERVSQKMWVNVDFKPGSDSDLFDDLPDPLGRKLFPMPG